MINAFFFLVLMAEFLASSSHILLKKSATIKYSSFIREYLNPWVICGYGLLFLSMVLTVFCYDGLGYMGVVVLEPINYVLVMILSRIFFKEKFTKRKLIGMGFIVLGIMIFYGLG